MGSRLAADPALSRQLNAARADRWQPAAHAGTDPSYRRGVMISLR